MSAEPLLPLRTEIAALKHCDEHDFIAKMIADPALPLEQRKGAIDLAKLLVTDCRADTDNQSLLDSFLLEFGLSNKEGVALMCLAEALLRVPDSVNMDRLIAEKISSGDWYGHAGHSSSPFVNAATWGMILTGKMVQLDPDITQRPASWIKELTSSLSEPIVRSAVMQAMRIMGGQYVLGRSIDEGFKQANKVRSSEPKSRIRYSYDMLGEAARTKKDAERYFKSYMDALEKIGHASSQTRISDSVADADGISVKLSALHPRYEVAQKVSVQKHLYSKIKHLCVMAKQHNIGLSIDAEEAARLEMSLDIFERLAKEPELRGWDGLGFVLQAYQKRAPSVARWLVEVSKHYDRKLMVRLVKGAYWDAEIKHAQEQGLSDYPVFTIKAHTDASYMACAKILMNASDLIFSQFATHNAQTVTALIQLADLLDCKDFEFQRLHGMGDLLYHHLLQHPDHADKAIRIYAPIGKHEDLLPYLVRRLLENGANSSFVNRFLDDNTPLDELVKDVIDDIARRPKYRHPKIPMPIDLYQSESIPRINSKGFDLDDDVDLNLLLNAIEQQRNETLVGKTIVGGNPQEGEQVAIRNPSDNTDNAGEVTFASAEAIEESLMAAHGYQQHWQDLGANGRGAILEAWADALEANTPELIGIISREAGRTLADAIDEVREAVDFCRYYSNQAQSPNYINGQALGTVFCVSPWNFPLAIFVGPISAALAAGNCVIAKPAEQTPAIATRAIELLLQAGCPSSAIHLLQGLGATIGNQVLGDARINGVAFTGSTKTAQVIHHALAQREGPSVPLLAETGGQNCMIVDSTALPEQVVDDVIRSSFHSAGQRCSALRVLYVQDEIADKLITMLKDACESVYVGDTRFFSSDMGPIIDQRARDNLDAHLLKMKEVGASVHRIDIPEGIQQQGNFFAPAIVEIDNISVLEQEVFGPVVHIIRYKANALNDVIAQINSTGFGLTLGVHSRIETIAEYVFNKTHAGNTYINRNVIGAVVGANPFGGSGLSGTGPKAGGPAYLSRFQSTTADRDAYPEMTADIIRAKANDLTESKVLPGPTGEENILSYTTAGAIGILASQASRSVTELAALACELGNEIVVVDTDISTSLRDAVQALGTTPELASMISYCSADQARTAGLSVLLAEADHPNKEELRKALAQSEGAITLTIDINQFSLHPDNISSLLPHLYEERTKTDNLIARGGNTQLFNLDE